MKKKTFISAVFSAAILMSAAVIAANAGAADVAYEPAVNSLTADSTETEKKSVAISDSLREFIDSGKGTRYVSITLDALIEDQLYAKAVAYAEAELGRKTDLNEFAFWNDEELDDLIQEYLSNQIPAGYCAQIDAFVEKYGIKERSRNDYNYTWIIAEVTPAQLEAMLSDESVKAIRESRESETATESPMFMKVYPPDYSSDVSTISGDANLDGKITVSDAVTVLQYLANRRKYPLSNEALANADIDGEPGITGNDVVAIQRIDAGTDFVPQIAFQFRTYDTKEEMRDYVVSENSAFTDHGLVYAPDYKISTVMNAGNDGKTDYIIIYGIDPAKCDGKLPEGIKLNNAEYEVNIEKDITSGSSFTVRNKGYFLLRSFNVNKIRIVFFMDGTMPGGEEKMTAEQAKKEYGFDVRQYTDPDYTVAPEAEFLDRFKADNQYFYDDHALVHAEGCRVDAVLNAGNDGKTDYLVVYGISPYKCYLDMITRTGSMPYAIKMNDTDYSWIYDSLFYSGFSYSITGKTDDAVVSPTGNPVRIVFFIDGMMPGRNTEMTAEEIQATYGFDVIPYVYPEGEPTDEEKFLSRLVSDDEDLEDQRFIYIDDHKAAAVLNSGKDGNIDYLVIYGMDEDECGLDEVFHTGNLPYSINRNNNSYLTTDIGDNGFYSGKREKLTYSGIDKPVSLSGNEVQVVYFITGIMPGYVDPMTEEEALSTYGFDVTPYVYPDGRPE